MFPDNGAELRARAELATIAHEINAREKLSQRYADDLAANEAKIELLRQRDQAIRESLLPRNQPCRPSPLTP